MIDWSQFTTNGGTRIDFVRVAKFGVSTVFGAIFTGLASVVLGFYDIPIALLQGFGDFLGTVVRVLTGLPELLIRGAWSEATTFVLDAGIAGFVVAVGLVAVTFYIVALGVSRVGG